MTQIPGPPPRACGRSHLTCQLKCGDACSRPAPNRRDDNPYLGDLLGARLSRRGALGAGLVGLIAVAGAGACSTAPGGAAGAEGAAPETARAAETPLGFTPVVPNSADRVVTAAGYTHHVVVRWGDPVVPGAPEFDFDRQTAAAQAGQFGTNCDFVQFFPRDDRRGLLWVNHEYTNELMMFRGLGGGEVPDLSALTDEQIRISMAAHGGSVVEIEQDGHGRWRLVRHGRRRYNRRVTASTPMQLTGPAAGSELLATALDPAGRTVLGTLNNCSGGVTPWGTVLTCEETVGMMYFVGGDGVPEPLKASCERYGYDTARRIPGPPTGPPNRHWYRVDERFDLARHPHEGHRFGWVVELDPLDPAFVPRKRTALGRLMHEGANVSLAGDGRVVVYMGDDERFDYFYKFVSRAPYREGDRRHNLSLLDDGTLYVARLAGNSPASEIDGAGTLPSDGAFDGTGEWVPLVSGARSHVPGMTAAEVCVFTRLAGDRVGATRMDRPEDIERNPVTGAVYVALTNNPSRTPDQPVRVDEANPRWASRHGHVLELVERGGDPVATRFSWSLPLVCGDPADPSTYFSGFDKARVSPISSPDNLTFDRGGNLWIATNSSRALEANDGVYAVPMAGPERGHLRLFLTVPYGAEATGPVFTPDQRTLFLSVQHPGEVGLATPESPTSRWPEGGQPRSAVVAVQHEQGDLVGR